MQSTPSPLKAFLPAVSLRGAGKLDVPTRRDLVGGCLWLDMSGFTPLTERLSAEGPEGIERLSETLNRLYSAVAGAAAATDGDVVFFAGDGALCLWEAQDEASCAAAAWLAVSAARRLLVDLSQAGQDGFRFELRQVVVLGGLTLDTVGGDEGAWLDVVSGPPLHALARLGAACRPGHILLSESVVDALGDQAQVTAAGDGTFELLDLLPFAGDRASRPVVRATGLEQTALAAAKVPAFLSGHLAQPSPPPSELRRVSIAFLQWGVGASPTADALQGLALALQQTARRHHGWLCQLVQDDKGLSGLVVFGLPGHAQGEEGVRAVRFASAVSRRVSALGFAVRFGVSTGSAFCGVCGGLERSQYCVLGSPVNRAARLAEVAIDGPLVDEATFLSAHWRVDFLHHAALRLKGLQNAVETYRPGAARETSLAPSTLVAFEHELTELADWLTAFASRADLRPLLIRGVLGAGKTAFLSQLPALCAAAGVEPVIGACDELEQYAGYVAVRPIMRRLLADTREEADMLWLRAALAARGQLEHLALLNPLLFADFAVTPLVQQMSPEMRAENRKQLAVNLVRERLGERQVVVVLDDAHWLDASSRELISALRAQITNLSFILAERTGGEALPPGLEEARVLELAPLDSTGVGQLMARLFSVRSASEPLREAVWRNARGNPLHCTELVRALLASGRVEVTETEVRLKSENTGELLEVPGTLEELIQGRFDRLSPVARGVLRTASVQGSAFELPVLREVLGTSLTLDVLEAALEEALERGVVRSRGTLQFEHASIQSVVYRLLLPSEQRQLHERTARALESLHALSLEPVAARLAYHWLRGDNAERAAFFSAMAADQALQGYANPDAEHLFRQAIEQDTAFRGALDVSLERARWSMLMAQALYSQSRHGEARRAYEAALRWTGLVAPGGPGQLPITLVRFLWGLLLSKLRGRAARLAQGFARERQILSIRIINAGLALDAWEGRLFEAANKAFIAFRLAERVGDAPEAAETVAGLGYLFSSTPARRYSEDLIVAGIRAADASADLQACASTRVLLGMHFTLVGQSRRAEEPLREARAFAERLGSGLWRHRAWFGLGEALLCSGQLQAAREAFSKAAEIAALAEPPVEGFANCMVALSLARAGQLAPALELVLGGRGLPLVAGHCLVLQRFASLGVAAELLLAAGRAGAALELAHEAFELSRTRRDVNVFFAALHGHTGTTLVFLELLERTGKREHTVRSAYARQARAALARLSAFSGMFPAARPAFELLSGRYWLALGRRARAVSALRRAAALAPQTQQPHERAVALHWLELVAAQTGLASNAELGSLDLRQSAWRSTRREAHEP